MNVRHPKQPFARKRSEEDFWINTRLKGWILGVLAAVAVTLVLEAVPNGLSADLAQQRLGGYFFVWPAIFGIPKVFIAMFVGAYVARISFVGPAVILSVLGWTFAIYFLNQIAHAAGNHSLFDVIAMNIVGLLIGIGGSIVGAVAGHQFYKKRIGDIADAT